MQNGGKPARHSVDQWDRVSDCVGSAMNFPKADQLPAKYSTPRTPLDHTSGLTTLAVMDRDRRLTGFLRGQTDNPKAPPGFELNNPWRVRECSSEVKE